MKAVDIDILQTYIKKRLEQLKEYKSLLIRHNQPHDYYTGMIEAFSEIDGLLDTTRNIE